MAGSPPSHLRMRASVEFAEPRTPPVTHAPLPRGAEYVPPRRPHTEFGVPGATETPGGGSEPRPILRHQSSNVRISSPLRKQVGFDDKPRIRPVLKSFHSSGSVGASGSTNVPERSPKLSLRERRGRARAQVSWAQTIAVPPTTGEFLEELATARPGHHPRNIESDAGSRYSRSIGSDAGSRYSTSIDGERPALRASRSLSARARPGNRPASAASSVSGPAGLWFDVPAPTAPHPSTCMPGFPIQEFPDHRPPKFSRELLRRPGVIMPKAAPRPASIATDVAPRPVSTQPVQVKRQPSTSRMSGFISRKLSKRSASHPPPDVPVPPLPIPRGPASSMPITPVGQFQQPPTTPHRSPMSFPPHGYGSPHRQSPQHAPQWPPQTMPAPFRGSALPPGAGHFVPNGAALPPSYMHALPPGAMPARAMTHMPVQPPHVLSPQEAARQALRHYRSSPALRVTSPQGLPTQWVERTPPPVSPLGGPQGYDDDLVVRQPDFAHPPIQDAPKEAPRPPHLSVDFGSGDIWADLETSFGGLSLPDLPADVESPGSPESDASHATTATATTRATHTTYIAQALDDYSDVGHASPFRAAASDAGHFLDAEHSAQVRRGTASDVGHATVPLVSRMQHRDVFSEAGHGAFERIYSPPSSPVLAKAAQRAASESECTIGNWSPGHKLSVSAPGSPFVLPPRGESLVASSLGATSNRPVFTGHMLNTPPRRTSSRSPSSMSLRSSTSMASESTISSLPSTMTSMTTASSAASVEMPDPIAEDMDELDVFGIVPGSKGYEQTPCRQVQFSTPESAERAEIRRVQRARSSVATLRVRSIA